MENLYIKTFRCGWWFVYQSHYTYSQDNETIDNWIGNMDIVLIELSQFYEQIALFKVNVLKFVEHWVTPKKAKINSTVPNQTASSLFAILASSLWIPALKTNILFENKKRKMSELLKHLKYCNQ